MLGVYRAAMLTGPTGSGNTVAAHLLARLSDYTPIEPSATRSRSYADMRLLLDTMLRTQCVEGWLASDMTFKIGNQVVSPKNTLLTIDEVESMDIRGTDYGGVLALNQLVLKIRIPVIVISTDRFKRRSNIPRWIYPCGRPILP